LGHAERVEDYGFRAVHLTRLTAMAITRAYYDRPSSHSYFMGCSDGGRESLMEAQRYPDDFDGWVVGAPANNFTALMVYFLHDAQLLSGLKEPLDPLKLQALTNAALRRCDAADGLQDGLVSDPLHCPFDPAELQCKGAADGSCLTTAQIAAVRRLYDGPRDAKTRARLAPGLRGTVGTESADAYQWPLWLTGPSAYPEIMTPLANFFSENFWPLMVYADPKIDWRTLELTQAAAQARSRTGAELNSLDPDLSVVRAAGKKIIQYHGWSDVAIPAELSVAYYEAVEKYVGGDNRDFYRLFMVPGMGHCAGGPGPNMFGASFHSPKAATDPEHDVLAALILWVEKATAPERIIATKYQDDDASKLILRTRPLCVYPKVARYIGKGSIDDAHNFVCKDK
jgi:feruloyl esterase